MGFRQIKWGFLFVLLSFRIQGIDILPATIGYILFAAGLQKLQSYSSHFRQAIPWTVVMAVVSLFEIYQRPTPSQPGIHVNGLQSLPVAGGLGILLAILFTVFTWVLDLLIVYHICMGTAEVAASRGLSLFAEVAEKRWSYYLTFKIVVMMSIIVAFMVPPLIIVLVIVGIIYTLVILVIMMGFMNEAEQTLG